MAERAKRKTERTKARPKKAKPEQGDIEVFHAHVYYDAESKRAASRVRTRAKKAFNITERSRNVKLGRFHDAPRGPHPVPMYLIWFKAKEFGRIVPWLSMNREGLSILVHPQLDDPVLDHTDHAMWLGEPLRLRLDKLGRRPPEQQGF